MRVLFCFFLVAVWYASASVKVHPLSDEFIAHINSKKPTWKAGRNFDINTPISYLHSLAGTVRRNSTSLPKKVHQVTDSEIPESFDAREAFTECSAIIGQIRDQASCGSCWALAAVEAMSDRICISSKGEKQISVSAEDLLDCCADCGYGCDGGDPEFAWLYWYVSGLVSGGEYGTTTGCKAYSIEPCAHHVESDRPACSGSVETPACVQTCDAGSSLKYEDDLSYGASVYVVDDDVKQIQQEILTNGPVEAAFDVYDDFFTYKSGVYQKTSGDLAGGHAVKILGWGVEDDIPYWLVANSWNTDWGDKGYFKILRGEDHVGIESYIVGGLPKLD